MEKLFWQQTWLTICLAALSKSGPQAAWLSDATSTYVTFWHTYRKKFLAVWQKLEWAIMYTGQTWDLEPNAYWAKSFAHHLVCKHHFCLSHLRWTSNNYGCCCGCAVNNSHNPLVPSSNCVFCIYCFEWETSTEIANCLKLQPAGGAWQEISKNILWGHISTTYSPPFSNFWGNSVWTKRWTQVIIKNNTVIHVAITCLCS